MSNLDKNRSSYGDQGMEDLWSIDRATQALIDADDNDAEMFHRMCEATMGVDADDTLEAFRRIQQAMIEWEAEKNKGGSQAKRT